MTTDTDGETSSLDYSGIPAHTATPFVFDTSTTSNSKAFYFYAEVDGHTEVYLSNFVLYQGCP